MNKVHLHGGPMDGASMQRNGPVTWFETAVIANRPSAHKYILRGKRYEWQGLEFPQPSEHILPLRIGDREI